MYHIIKIDSKQDKILDSSENFNDLVFWFNTLVYEYQQCKYCIKKGDKVIVRQGYFASKVDLLKTSK